MTIITISRGSSSRGKEIAEKVADKLGFECVARATLHEASEEYHIPEVKLVNAIHDAPSILDRFVGGKTRYIAYIHAALTSHLKQGNVVYHGLAGHFFLEGISHVLKVRINADLEHRVAIVMKREKVSHLKAARIIRKDDEERRKWSLSLYGIDQHDSHLYDLVINTHRISVNDAVDTICRLAQTDGFLSTEESQQNMEDLALAAAVRCRLIGLKPDIEVTAEDGVVLVKTAAYPLYQETFEREIRNLAMSVEGVKDVRVELESTPHFS